MEQRQVFLLWHSYKAGDAADHKLVGVYSTHAEAEAAIMRKLQFEGFRDYPSGFLIDPYVLDRDAWSEGFVSDIG
jgi:hypothetical protein